MAQMTYHAQHGFPKLVTFGVLIAMMTSTPAIQAETMTSSPTLLISYDMLCAWFPARNLAREGADAATIKHTLNAIIDAHADAEIDVFVQGVFARFETQRHDFTTAQGRADLEQNGVIRLIEAGDDLVEIMRDRCEERGMTFLAGIRMNDRHRANPFLEKMFEAHPEWRLMGSGINYKYDGAREAVLAFIAEFLDRYDVAGIEFDYLRWGHVFDPAEAEGHAPLLTDFTRRARALLDAAATKRGRKRLMLGVRVPQTLEECRDLGMDLGAWIKEGLVDYVSPTDFFYTDFNTRIEDYAALTQDTACRLYPTIHPVIASGNQATLLPEAGYRAAAKNFDAFGAHGISSYNYQYNWAQMYGGYKFGPKEMWPEALQFMGQLGDPAAINGKSRRYFFHPLWTGGAPTGATKNDRIVLPRGGTLPGTMRMRLAEDPTDPHLAATLEFKAVGMVEGDRLEVSINGNTVGGDKIERHFDADGQSENEGRKLRPYFGHRMQVPMAHFVHGDNTLEVRLATSAGEEPVDVQEVEVEFKK